MQHKPLTKQCDKNETHVMRKNVEFTSLELDFTRHQPAQLTELRYIMRCECITTCKNSPSRVTVNATSLNLKLLLEPLALLSDPIKAFF